MIKSATHQRFIAETVYKTQVSSIRKQEIYGKIFKGDKKLGMWLINIITIELGV